MCKILLLLKLLVDADAWQFLYFIFFAPLFKKRSRTTAIETLVQRGTCPNKHLLEQTHFEKHNSKIPYSKYLKPRANFRFVLGVRDTTYIFGSTAFFRKRILGYNRKCVENCMKIN